MTNEEAIKTIKHGCIYRDKRGGEALEVAVNALEKQMPKKVEVTKYDIGGNNYFCSCGNKLRNGSEYCDKCGCKLDWSDIE